MTRRSLLVGSSAAMGLAAWNALPAAARAGFLDLEAAPGEAQLLEAGEPATPIWGYGGRVPGPVIRARQGDEVRVRLRNGLPQPTTVHWHGIRIANAMDGVAGLTQDPVQPGESFDYAFRVPDAGTYWYHPHNRSWEQLARGLYGLLVVEEPEPPFADRDLPFVIDDWRLDESGRIHEASFGDMRDWSHAGRLGNVLTVNGADFGALSVRAGERIRLRLCSTANARVLRLAIRDHEAVLVALDGMPLAAPRTIADGVSLSPGQRADLFLDMAGEPGRSYDIWALDDRTGRELAIAGQLVYGADPPVRDVAELPDIAPLTPNPLRTDLDLGNAEAVELRIEGGAMGGLAGAEHQGQMLDLRDLVRRGLVWAMNGVAGRTETPLFSVSSGRTVHVRMVNDTAWPHGMHFHGHHVRPVGGPLAADWRDTVLLPPRSEQDVAFVADNPGKWMLHCHMLEHQAGGMATWFQVT